MSAKYLYNPNTGKLHIEGYCTHTIGKCDTYIAFNSEKAALAFDGRAVSMCKLCEKEREKRI